MVFTANGGLVRGQDVVRARFRHAERRGEERHFQTWFEANGFKVHELSSGSFEGEGDALFAGNKLFCGWGFRSDLAVYDQIGTILQVQEIIPVKLQDERFYHLDTCFCPLYKSLALIYPGASFMVSVKLWSVKPVVLVARTVKV